MKFKDILSIVRSAEQDGSALDLAEALSRQNGGHISVDVVGWAPPSVPAEQFDRNPGHNELIKAAEAALATETGLVKRRAPNAERVQSELLYPDVAESDIAMHARHCDVTIVARPTRATWRSARTILDAAMFNSGRPIIVAPPAWKSQAIGGSVLVAWKPTREAARALAEADDFIAQAGRATICTVDAIPNYYGYGPIPGSDVAAHLARRGYQVDLVNLSSGGRSEARATLDQAMAVNADLIVMGGFGRSRVSEFIFGGMTREMLETSPVPLLMAH